MRCIAGDLARDKQIGDIPLGDGENFLVDRQPRQRFNQCQGFRLPGPASLFEFSQHRFRPEHIVSTELVTPPLMRSITAIHAGGIVTRTNVSAGH
jgi:hypothetical protein